MKRLYLLTTALLVISLTSMMLIEKNENQEAKPIELENSQPMFYKGQICFKVKEGIKDLPQQKGNVLFNIPSLDSKAGKYEVDLLEKRFWFNPKNMKKGMPDLSRIYRIEFPEGFSVTKVAREFSRDPNIEYAEPIPLIHLLEIPNDPMYGDLHHLTQIHAEEAWEIHKGENGPEDIIIAIVDSGTEWDHEDLVDNIWQNMGEDLDGDGKTIEFSEGEWIFDPDDENGVDDDGNGYVDDLIGWNFYLNNNDPNPVPGTFMWEHGTKMGGYASASTNNSIGIASISWNLKILPIQSGWESDVLQSYNAMIYAAENGADIISNSWGHYDFYSQAHHEAVIYVNNLGSIILGGAANDNQTRLMYPAAYPGVMGVAALNNMNEKASYSNYGPHIAISAPGGDGAFPLKTTNVNNSYTTAGGTSCATPIIAGLLGLVKSYHPEWTSDQVITKVLASADNIDQVDPAYENLLGAGMINAYMALYDTTIELQQEIALDLFYAEFQDLDGNHIPEQGDTISLSLKLINYNYGVGAVDVTFELISDDPDITILNDTYTGDIPADDYFKLENAFEFKISQQATTHFANLKLITTADKDITWGNTIFIDILVAPSGIIVYQGEGVGYTYSGDYFNEFLNAQGFEVFYTSHFPSSLIGFDAVFLSYGNHGIRLREGTAITMEMSRIINEYLYEGGKCYVECGSFFGAQFYFGYPDYDEIIDLFGINEIQFPAYSNVISLLEGLENSICQDLVFSGSTQNLNWHIDAMIPNENGVTAFEEDNYGTVAVQGEGEFGQKTFAFSYALAHLEDGPQGTRDELMGRIVEFLDLYDPVADFMADTTFIEEGDTIQFTDLSGNNPTSWEWMFEGGTPASSTNQNPSVIYNTPGLYDVKLIVTNEYGSDTLSIEEYITVDPETGIKVQYIDKVGIFPNPINSNPSIEFYLLNETQVQISILDIHGRVVSEILTEELQSGKNRVSWNAEKISTGVYFCRLKIGNELITRKAVKIE